MRTTFQVLNSRMWPVATVLDKTDTELLPHPIKFYRIDQARYLQGNLCIKCLADVSGIPLSRFYQYG